MENNAGDIMEYQDILYKIEEASRIVQLDWHIREMELNDTEPTVQEKTEDTIAVIKEIEELLAQLKDLLPKG